MEDIDYISCNIIGHLFYFYLTCPIRGVGAGGRGGEGSTPPLFHNLHCIQQYYLGVSGWSEYTSENFVVSTPPHSFLASYPSANGMSRLAKFMQWTEFMQDNIGSLWYTSIGGLVLHSHMQSFLRVCRLNYLPFYISSADTSNPILPLTSLLISYWHSV